VRSLIAQDFRDAFTKVDAIVTPTSPVPAFKLGERTNDPLQMYLADIYTVTGSLAECLGFPCLAERSVESCRWACRFSVPFWRRAGAAISASFRGRGRSRAVAPVRINPVKF